MSDPDDLDDLGPVKTPLFKNPAVLLAILVIAGGAGWYAYTEANPTPDGFVRQGNSALAADDADGAILAFEGALKLDAGRLDAHKGLAEAFGRKKAYDQRVAWLKRAVSLGTAGEEDAMRLKQELAAAALQWAAAVEGDDDEAYDEALTIAAGADSQSEAHALLGAHLMALVELHSTRDEHAEAAEHAARAQTLKIKKADKLTALEAEAAARVALFAPAFAKEFATQHKEALLKSKQYDDKNQGFYVKIEAEIPWSGPTRTPAQVRIHEVNVKNLANKLVRDELIRMLLVVAGPKADASVLPKLPPSVTQWEQQTWSEGWVRHPTKYGLGVVVPFDEATRLVWLLRNGATLVKAG